MSWIRLGVAYFALQTLVWGVCLVQILAFIAVAGEVCSGAVVQIVLILLGQSFTALAVVEAVTASAFGAAQGGTILARRLIHSVLVLGSCTLYAAVYCLRFYPAWHVISSCAVAAA